MLCVLYFCHKDIDQAARLLSWIRDLGGVKNHSLMLAFSQRVEISGAAAPLIAAAKEAFGDVVTFTPYDEDERGWPQSPNHAWQHIVRHIANRHPKALPAPQPWLWMEPDAVPLVPEWMDKLEAEYKANGKPFLGSMVNLPGIAEHMSGIAIYPPDVLQFTSRMVELDSIAWDVFFAPDFLPYAHLTNLVQHVFWSSRNPDVEWRFREDKDFATIDPKAVVFHRDKEGKLIEWLRSKNQPFQFVEIGGAASNSPLGNPAEPKAGWPTSIEWTQKPTVFTYFDEVPEINGTDAARLLELWQIKWREHGWQTYVLSEVDAREHPMFAIYDTTVSAFPKVNPPRYERACFLRWLAMAHAGGGFMVDYDTMPLDFKPMDVPKRLTVYQDHNPCPSLVAGSREEFERICRWFMAWELTDYDRSHSHGTHVSDMTILQQSCDRFDVKDRVLNYGKAGWQQAGAVHFASATMGGKQPRWKFIPEILDALNPKMPSDGEKALAQALTRIQELEAEVVRLSRTVTAPTRAKPVATPKKRKAMTPERKAQLSKNLAKARAAKAQKLVAA